MLAHGLAPACLQAAPLPEGRGRGAMPPLPHHPEEGEKLEGGFSPPKVNPVPNPGGRCEAVPGRGRCFWVPPPSPRGVSTPSLRSLSHLCLWICSSPLSPLPLPAPLSSGCPLGHLSPLSLSSPAAERAARGSLTCPGKRGRGRGHSCSHPAPSLQVAETFQLGAPSFSHSSRCFPTPLRSCPDG